MKQIKEALATLCAAIAADDDSDAAFDALDSAAMQAMEVAHGQNLDALADGCTAETHTLLNAMTQFVDAEGEIAQQVLALRLAGALANWIASKL